MTPFGMFNRTIRLEQGVLLKDFAERVGVSSAYLSALEHGKKGTPNAALVSEIERQFDLTAQQRKDLHEAVRDSATTLTIPPKAKPSVFHTAHAFARKLPDLSDRQLRLIDDILKDKEKP